MKLLPHEKEAGLEVPDAGGQPSGLRYKANKDGVIEIPEGLRGYGELAQKTGLFSEVGVSWGGFGEGKLPKPWRTSGLNG